MEGSLELEKITETRGSYTQVWTYRNHPTDRIQRQADPYRHTTQDGVHKSTDRVKYRLSPLSSANIQHREASTGTQRHTYTYIGSP